MRFSTLVGLLLFAQTIFANEQCIELFKISPEEEVAIALAALSPLENLNATSKGLNRLVQDLGPIERWESEVVAMGWWSRRTREPVEWNKRDINELKNFWYDLYLQKSLTAQGTFEWQVISDYYLVETTLTAEQIADKQNLPVEDVQVILNEFNADYSDSLKARYIGSPF